MEEDDIPTFAARIKAKYPDYASVDDYELVERVVRKHPVYASQVKLPSDFKLLQTSTGYPKLDELYENAGRANNVDPNLLLEQGRVESVNFNPDVVYGRRNSPAGARGLGQFMPGTAPRFGLTVNDKVDDRADPTKSVPAQAKYMRTLLDMFNNDEQLALAGYNAGEGAVQKHGNKIPPFAETQKYTKMIGDALSPIRAKGLTLRPPVQNTPYVEPTTEIDDPYAQIGATTQSNATPEKPSAFEAQFAVANDGKNMSRSSVFFPNDGTNRVLDYANKLDQKQWGLFPDQAHKGTHLINLAKAKKLKLRTPQEIQDFIDKNPNALKTLGIAVDDVGNATQGTVVTAKKDGVEQATAVVRSPETAEQQIKVYQDQFPDAEIGVTDTDTVTDERMQPVDPSTVDELARQFGGNRAFVQGKFPVNKVAKPSKPKQPITQPVKQPQNAVKSQVMPPTGELTEKDYQDYFTANPDLIDTPANRNAFAEMYKANQGFGKDVEVSAEIKQPEYTAPTNPVASATPTPTQVARGGKGDIDSGIYVDVPVDQGELIGQKDPNAYLSKKATYALADANGISRSIADQWLAKKGGSIIPEDRRISEYEQSLAKKGKNINVNINNSLAKEFMTFAGKDFTPNIESIDSDPLKPVPYEGRDFGKEFADDVNTVMSTLNPLTGKYQAAAIGELAALPGDLSGMAGGIIDWANKYSPSMNAIREIADKDILNPNFDKSKPESAENPLRIKQSARDLNVSELRQFYENSRAMAEKTGEKNPDGTDTYPTMAFRMLGATPKIAFLSLMPGGLIGGLAMDQAAVTQLHGGSNTDVFKSAIKGGLEGTLFKFLPKIGKAGSTFEATLVNKAPSTFVKNGVELATLMGGSLAIGKAFGTPDQENLINSLALAAFHSFGMNKKAVEGKTVHAVDTKGNEVYAKVENGKLVSIEPQKTDMDFALPARQKYFRQDAAIKDQVKTAEVKSNVKVPETAPEPETQYSSALDEIRQKGADTKAKIKEIFPHLSNEEAADLRRQAFPDTPKVEAKSKPVDKPVENKAEEPIKATGEDKLSPKLTDAEKAELTAKPEMQFDPIKAADEHLNKVWNDPTITPEKAAESILKTYESTNTQNTRIESAKTTEVKTDSNADIKSKTESKVDDGNKGTEIPNTGERGQGETPTQITPRLNVPKEYGASNERFTRDKAEQAKAILLKKFGGSQNTMGSGLPHLDAETLGALKDLAGFHLEAGVKKLGELADKVAAEVGDWSRPHIESIYAGMGKRENSGQIENSGQGEVKVSKSIAQKAVDNQELPLDTAKYDKTTDKGRQAAMDDLVANHPEQMQRILDGKEKVPETMLGHFIKAVEDYTKTLDDPQRQRDIRRALIEKVTPETSKTAQELQGLRVREQDSLTVIAKDLIDARKAAQKAKGHDVEGMQKRIADLEKQLEEHKAGLAKEQTKADVAEAVTAERVSRPFIDRAEKYAEKLRTEADKARERLKKRGAVFTSGVDPVALKDLAQIGASHIADVGLDFAKFSDKMVGEFGKKIEPHLKNIYDKAQEVATRFERRAVRMIEGRLETQIEALERQIETKTRDVIKREPIPLSEKGKELQAKRDALRKELDELVPKEQKTRTVAQKQEAYKKNLERQIEALTKQIETGEKPVRSQTPTNPVIDRLKAKRDDLKAQLPAIDKTISDAKYNETRAKSLQKQIQDLDDQIKTGVRQTREVKARELSPEVEQLIEKRDALRERHTEVFGKPEMSDAKRLQMWKKAGERRIAILKGEAEAPQKRPRVTLDAEGENIATQINLLKQKVDITDAEVSKIADMTKNLVDARAKLEGHQRTKPLAKATPEEIAYATAKVELSEYVDDLKIKASRTSRAEFKEASKKDKAKILARGAGKIAAAHPGFTKNILAALDASATALTGWRMGMAHPAIWAKNALKAQLDMVKTFGNQPVEKALKIDIQSRPNQINGKYEKMGLDVSAREEDFPMTNPFGRLSNVIDKIPTKGGIRPSNIGKQALKVVPNAFVASENAFVGFQHRNRADLADLLLPRFEQTPRTEMDYKNLGRLINGLTGRGYLGKSGERASEIVNVLMFAPRFLKSELDALGHIITGGATLGELTKSLQGKDGGNTGTNFVRMEAAKNLAKFVAGTATILALANALKPGSVELDPRSADFGKIKIGNTRFDVSGHMASLVTLAARLATNESKSSTTGKVTPLNEKDNKGKAKWGGMTTLDVMEHFVEGKASPYGHAFLDWLKSEDFHGNPVDLTTAKSWDRMLTDMHIPLPVQNAKELLNDPNAAPIWAGIIADYFGVTTNTYGGSKHVQRLMKEAKERGDDAEVKRLEPILQEEQKIEAEKNKQRREEVKPTTTATPAPMPMQQKK